MVEEEAEEGKGSYYYNQLETIKFIFNPGYKSGAGVPMTPWHAGAQVG